MLPLARYIRSNRVTRIGPWSQNPFRLADRNPGSMSGLVICVNPRFLLVACPFSDTDPAIAGPVLGSRYFDWDLVAYRRYRLPSARNLVCNDDLSQKLHIGERIATEIKKIINVELSRSCDQPTRYWGHVLWKSTMASVPPLGRDEPNLQ